MCPSICTRSRTFHSDQAKIRAEWVRACVIVGALAGGAEDACSTCCDYYLDDNSDFAVLLVVRVLSYHSLMYVFLGAGSCWVALPLLCRWHVAGDHWRLRRCRLSSKVSPPLHGLSRKGREKKNNDEIPTRDSSI